MRRLVPLIALAVAVGCVEEPQAPAAGTRFRFEFEGAAEFWSAPLPSDHRRHPDGTADLGGFPNPDGVPFVDTLIGLVDGALAGFGTTSTIFLPLDGALEGDLELSVHETVQDSSAVFLVGVEPGSEDFGVRIPVDVRFLEDPGPFGAPNLLALLPLQGRPLLPETMYAAVALTELRDADGEPVGPAPQDRLPHPYPLAVEALVGQGTPRDEIAGLAVFTTQDPTAELLRLAVEAAEYPPEPHAPPELTDVFDEYCVYRTTVPMPVFQAGDPPFLTGGGGIAWGDGGAPVLQTFEDANLDLTVPRGVIPEGGWPVALFIRTGGGGERPLVDRGVQDAEGTPLEEGGGLARQLAQAGFAGVSVDGPHGGLRNVTGGDEQFLIFNIANPVAMRDNLRQSAAELALVPDLLSTLTFDTGDCPGASPTATFAPDGMALLGHSMGATIAPLVLRAEPRFGATVLSGAGGSWIHNIVHKLSPLEVRPMAEAILGYGEGQLTDFDPALSLLQWAGESADPPPYAWPLSGENGPQTLVLQGIVDTYILPPMANATTLSMGLDLGGDALDRDHPELVDFRPAEEVLGLVGRGPIELPAGGNLGGVRTALVVQHAEDGIQDGHEVMFQTEAPRYQIRCFLESYRTGVPAVPEGAGAGDPCEP